MLHIMLSNLQLILFFTCFIIENFIIAFIYYLTISNIIIYCIVIIANIPNKVIDYIKLKIVKTLSR